jgi:hypothetical protein
LKSMPQKRMPRKHTELGLLVPIVLLSLPSAIYGVIYTIPLSVRKAMDPWFQNQHGAAHFAVLSWFFISMAGPIPSVLGLALYALLIFRRRATLSTTLVASALVLLSIIGTIIIELQIWALRR